jgi:prepilin-type N-terminal cleavage/methylation domain-containing protein/prepilin-type processing-associated H-X9-DG protein
MHRDRKKQTSGGFTLVELLVVIAIMAVLIALLLSAVQMAREAANRMTCQSNLRQLAIACQSYNDTNGALPPAFPKAFNGTFVKTQAALLPFLEQEALYQEIVNNSANFSMTVAPPAVFSCPSDRGIPTPAIVSSPAGLLPPFRSGVLCGITSYKPNVQSNPVAILGLVPSGGGDGVILYKGSVNMVSITDGTSSTILFGEFSNYEPNWPPYAALFDGLTSALPFSLAMSEWSGIVGFMPRLSGGYPVNSRISLPMPTDSTVAKAAAVARAYCYGSSHLNGANVAFCDGSVHFLSNAVSHTMVNTASGSVTLLQALCTRAGGETISGDAF